MPESTPRRPGKPGQNRDSRDGVFGHLESQVGPLPRVGRYARVSTPHQHTIGMQLRHEGRQHGRPRSASLQADEVRRLASEGLSKSEIARRLSIGRTSVRRILQEGS